MAVSRRISGDNWASLSGKLDKAVSWNEGRGAVIDEGSLSSLLLAASRQDKFKPYLESCNSFKNYVSAKCLERRLDYLKMPQELRSPSLEKLWRKDHPYLLEEKEFELLGCAYQMGAPRRVTLQEAAGPGNSYIGGDVFWSRFLELSSGPVVGGGRVTGIGQIDYKDCTNVYAVFEGNRNAIDVFRLSKAERSTVLERVFELWKARKMPLYKKTQPRL